MGVDAIDASQAVAASNVDTHHKSHQAPGRTRRDQKINLHSLT